MDAFCGGGAKEAGADSFLTAKHAKFAKEEWSHTEAQGREVV